MPSFSSGDVIGAIDRRLRDVAGAQSPNAQAIAISEAVMWLWMLGDTFNALTHLLSDYLTDMVGAPIWSKLPPAKNAAKNMAQEADYRRLLEGRIVLDTLQPLVAALRAALL